MESGEVQRRDHVYYVAFTESTARLFRVEVREVLYPGTTHESIVGDTYDVGTGNWIRHEISHESYWPDQATALNMAQAKLVDDMQRLRSQARALGFFLK